MKDELREKVLESLNNHVKKANTIKQAGFISSKFYINSLIYNLQLDTITLKDEKEEVYISINLNQVYKVETLKNSIQIYLDNDTQICIQI